MYLDFFKFNKNPFHITPDPEFLFMSPSHREALESIFHAIEHRKGFIAITGEVGVGKTTILRSYIEKTDPRGIRAIYLFNAALSFDNLLEQMISEFDIPAPDEDPPRLTLCRYLNDEHKDGRNVVLIIDEAQNMPVETLDRLPTLADLEASGDKLLQIILVGQPEFEKKLNLPELKQLNKHIVIRCRIDTLKPDESLAYIEHRLTKASSRYNPVFTKKALKRIVEEANGIPRLINVLCDNTLIAGLSYQRNPVDGYIAREVIRDFRDRRPQFSFSWKFVAAPTFILFLVLAAITSMSLNSSRKIAPVRTDTLSAKGPEPSTAAGVVKEYDFKDARTFPGIGHLDKSPQVDPENIRELAAASTNSVRTNTLPSTYQGQPSPGASRPSPISRQEKTPAQELIALAQAQFTNNPAKAEKLLHKAIDSEPANYEGYFQLGRLLTLKRDYSGAIQQYQKALRINNQIAAIYFNMGYIYLKKGIYGLARDSYEKCLASSPSYKDEVLTNLGVIELKAGNRMRAKDLFLEALQLNAGNKLARKHLVRLGAVDQAKTITGPSTGLPAESRGK